MLLLFDLVTYEPRNMEPPDGGLSYQKEIRYTYTICDKQTCMSFMQKYFLYMSGKIAQGLRLRGGGDINTDKCHNEIPMGQEGIHMGSVMCRQLAHALVY